MGTLAKQRAVGLAAMALLLLAGCSQSKPAPASNQSEVLAKTEAPAQVVAAKAGFWPMYTAAHQWASDVVVIRVTAKEIPGFKNGGGRAGMWEAAFGSPSLRQYRIYRYSVADVPPGIFKGVVAGLPMSWAGPSREAMPVDTAMFNTDSDAAYEAAAADAGEWLKKNPGKPLSAFEIGATYRYQVPVWYLMWGNKQSGFAALVDASSGKVLKHK